MWAPNTPQWALVLVVDATLCDVTLPSSILSSSVKKPFMEFFMFPPKDTQSLSINIFLNQAVANHEANLIPILYYISIKLGHLSKNI